MSLIVFDLNHKSAPIAIREKLAHLNEMTIPEADGYTLEAVPICTCNRVEIYYSGVEKDARASFIELLARKNIKYDDLKEYFYDTKKKIVFVIFLLLLLVLILWFWVKTRFFIR